MFLNRVVERNCRPDRKYDIIDYVLPFFFPFGISISYKNREMFHGVTPDNIKTLVLALIVLSNPRLGTSTAFERGW